MSLTPRPFQIEDAARGSAKRRIIYTHQPGMGKTLVGSMTLDGVRPNLVSCPSYLVRSWERHLRSEFPDEMVLVAAGMTPRQKQITLDWAASSEAEWLIVNHEMLRDMTPHQRNQKEEAGIRTFPTYRMPKVKGFIIDEAHHLRNHRSQAWRGADRVAQRAEVVALLTATPIYTTAADCYAELRLLDHKFKSYWDFVSKYCETRETPFGVQIVGAKPTLKQVFQQYAIGRTYQEVGLPIPEMVAKHIYVKLAPLERARYDNLKKTYRDAGTVTDPAGAVLALRRLTAESKPKLDMLKSMLRDEPPTLVFTWFRETAYRLGELLGLPAITGDDDQDDRARIAESADKGLVANIAALSEGVDLSHLHRVVFFEEHQSPGRMKQARSRVERWRKDGSDEPVSCFYLMAEKTIDVSVHKVWQTRAISADELLAYELSNPYAEDAEV